MYDITAEVCGLGLTTDGVETAVCRDCGGLDDNSPSSMGQSDGKATVELPLTKGRPGLGL